jgi:3'-5' exoribonuclease
MKLISDLEVNQAVTSYSQVQRKQVRLKRNGEPYLRLLLRDKSGQIESKVWDNVEECDRQIQEGDFVKYQGLVQIYNGNKQLIVEKIRQAVPEDRMSGFDEGEMIPRSEYDIDGMWQKLCSLVIEHASRPCLRELLNNVLKKNEEKIKSYPAGVEIHHNYWGGFLEHVLSVLESALFFSDKYPALDKDLLVAGAVLHDIGKLEELSTPHNPTYTVRGQLIGHVVMGRDLVRREASCIPEFPVDLLTQLEHLILSHQGQPEWGSPKRPQTREALILHYIDDLDAKLNRFYRVMKQDQGDSDFTPFDRYLGRAVFKGDLADREDRLLVASGSE